MGMSEQRQREWKEGPWSVSGLRTTEDVLVKGR